jgi:hypothetical protein
MTSKTVSYGGNGRMDMQTNDGTEGTIFRIMKNEQGKIGWILLWALGIPIPVLLVLFVLRGCT